jgi:hypothetical protein
MSPGGGDEAAPDGVWGGGLLAGQAAAEGVVGGLGLDRQGGVEIDVQRDRGAEGVEVALLGATEEEDFVDPPTLAEAPTVPARLECGLRAEGLGPR